jgi:hypothetical protein
MMKEITNMNNKTTELIRTFAMSRRHFLKATAVAGSLAAANTLSSGTIAGLALGHAAAQEGGDVGVLKYALTLEHLENALYRTLIGSGLLSGTALDAAKVYGGHESEHVRDLTAALQKAGATGIPQELAKYNFPTLTSQAEVLNTLADVEDLGAAAYLGAAPMIENDDYLTFAVQIHTVEAEHATGIRFLAGKDIVPFAFAEPKTMDQVLAVVGPILGTGLPDTGLNGDTMKMVGIAGGVAAAAAGLALARGSQTATEQE